MNLQVNNLEKKFGGNRVLQKTTLTLKSNKINLLMGNNGSGKTTLINCVSGTIGTDGGNVFFGDDNITKIPTHQIFTKGIMRTFQTPRLFANLSVFENMMLARYNPGESFSKALFYGKWDDVESENSKKAMQILEQLDLIALKNNLAYDLSGGQIKLLELGKALMSDAKLVILDEPIAGINPKLAHKIFHIIKKICKEKNTTFLIIEHRLDIALLYSDYAFVIDHGKIIAHDSPESVLEHQLVKDSYLK